MARNRAFNLFYQQDAAEILSYILEELCGESIYASESIRIHIRQTISCTACQQYTSAEDSSPVSGSIQNSLNSYLESNFLRGENEFFCNIYSSNNQALADHEISKVGDCLIIQLKHFLVFNQAVTKDITKISCTPTLTVPVTLDEDKVGHKKFNLICTINHTSNWARGHYTSSIKSTSSWFHCNDTAVIPSNEKAVINDTSNIFFYQNVPWEYEKKGRGKLWVSECYHFRSSASLPFA